MRNEDAIMVIKKEIGENLKSQSIVVTSDWYDLIWFYSGSVGSEDAIKIVLPKIKNYVSAELTKARRREESLMLLQNGIRIVIDDILSTHPELRKVRKKVERKPKIKHEPKQIVEEDDIFADEE